MIQQIKLAKQPVLNLSAMATETKLSTSSRPRLITLATWNKRGLKEKYKQTELVNDTESHKLEVVSLQETKIKKYSEETLQNGYKLILLEQKTATY
jgi:hypothetical protein